MTRPAWCLASVIVTLGVVHRAWAATAIFLGVVGVMWLALDQRRTLRDIRSRYPEHWGEDEN